MSTLRINHRNPHLFPHRNYTRQSFSGSTINTLESIAETMFQWMDAGEIRLVNIWFFYILPWTNSSIRKTCTFLKKKIPIFLYLQKYPPSSKKSCFELPFIQSSYNFLNVNIEKNFLLNFLSLFLTLAVINR